MKKHVLMMSISLMAVTALSSHGSFFDEIEKMQRELRSEMSRVWDDMGSGLRAVGRRVRFLPTPTVDVKDKQDRYELIVDVPAGWSKDDLKIRAEEKSIEISGERKEEEKKKETDDEKYVVRERASFEEFSRVIPLSGKIVPEKVSADFKDGVLTITAPKAPEAITKGVDVSIK